MAQKQSHTLIIITIEDHVFTCLPIKCYNLKDIDETKLEYTVIMYKLTHEFQGKMLRESVIPYYISDGQTNRLYADMLFPFMCFNSKTKETPVCPLATRKDLSNYGMLKYEIIHNLNLDSITKEVEKNFINNIYTPDEIHSLEQLEFISKEHDPTRMKDISSRGLVMLNQYCKNLVGITSIFRRIQNILDFIICVSSKKLRSYTEENLDTFIPLITRPGLTPILLVFERIYRKHVLNQLIKSITLLESIKIIAYTDIELDVTLNTFNEFNQDLSICDRYRNPKTRKDELYDNLTNYKHISHELYELLYTYKRDLFPYLLNPKDIKIIADGKEFDDTLRAWHASCDYSAADKILENISTLPLPNFLSSIKMFSLYKGPVEHKIQIKKAILLRLRQEIPYNILSKLSLIEKYAVYFPEEIYKSLLESYLPELLTLISNRSDKPDILFIDPELFTFNANSSDIISYIYKINKSGYLYKRIMSRLTEHELKKYDAYLLKEYELLTTRYTESPSDQSRQLMDTSLSNWIFFHAHHMGGMRRSQKKPCSKKNCRSKRVKIHRM